MSVSLTRRARGIGSAAALAKKLLRKAGARSVACARHPDAHERDDVGYFAAEYVRHRHGRLLRFGRIYSLCTLLFVAIMIVLELLFRDFPPASIAWRCLPLISASLFLAASLLPARHNPMIMRFLYSLNGFTLMVMMCGLVYIVQGTQWYYGYINGLIVVIFIVYLLSFSGSAAAAAIYLPPFFALCVALLVTVDDRARWMVALSNPGIMIVGLTILAGLQERLRFREYRSSRIVEKQTAIIRERNELLSRELAQARSIQESLIPASLPVVPGARFHAVFIPMDEVGGDLFDFITLPGEGNVGMFIGDVVGHGVPAALVTSMIKALLGAAGPLAGSPAELLSYLNEKTLGKTGGGFFTAAYGQYRAAERSLTIARGGHCPPYLVRGGRVTALAPRGAMMGTFESLRFEERTIDLQAGDRVLFYTDGLTEALGRSGGMFEECLVRELLPALPDAADDTFVAYLRRELSAFCGRTTFDDDVCMVGLEILP